MLNVGVLNQKIIAQSVKTTAVQPSVPKITEKKEGYLSDKNLKIADKNQNNQLDFHADIGYNLENYP